MHFRENWLIFLGIWGKAELILRIWVSFFPILYYIVQSCVLGAYRTDYLFDVNYTVSSRSNTIIIIYISRSQILLKCLNQVVVLI